MNLIGEHTDYNGGKVLPAALALGVEVAVRFRDDRDVRGLSREEGGARAQLDAPPRGDWLDYARGVARELRAAGRIPERGFEIAVAGDLPAGAGLSSSAALEAASALALSGAAGMPVRAQDRAALARLCQRAEAEFVGVPCGIMDQLAVLEGSAGCALLLDCGTLARRAIRLPEGLELLIVDTGVERALRGGDYAVRRRECERALAAARAALGRRLEALCELGEGDLPRLARALDPLAFRRARHAILESARVEAFAAALEAGDLAAAGALMRASHASLRHDFEVTCAESDRLVELSGALPGVVGGRMTGAGWGGCTVHLVERGLGASAAARLGEAFRAEFGRAPRWWVCDAAGGAALEPIAAGP